MKVFLIALMTTVISTATYAADNLILVTIDGLRWQEVFTGYDPELIEHEKYTKNKQQLIERFGGRSIEEKRAQLMPFLWSIVAKKRNYSR